MFSFVKVRFAQPFGQPGVQAGTWPGFDLLQCLQTRRWSSLKLGAETGESCCGKSNRVGIFRPAAASGNLWRYGGVLPPAAGTL